MKLDINAVSLKVAALALVRRCESLGIVSKAGSPVVVDQAYELVAAILGMRNQHALRASFAADRLTPPGEIFAAGIRANESQNLSTKDGESARKLTFLSQFGVKVIKVDATGQYTWCLFDTMADAGFQSHDAAVFDAWDQTVHGVLLKLRKGYDYWSILSFDSQKEVITSVLMAGIWNPSLIGDLQALGYQVRISDCKRPYWEFDGEGSEDFETAELAWQDAWRDAVSAGRISGVSSTKGVGAQARELQREWGDEHPDFAQADWRHEVAAGYTKLSYWEWVVHQLDAAVPDAVSVDISLLAQQEFEVFNFDSVLDTGWRVVARNGFEYVTGENVARCVFFVQDMSADVKESRRMNFVVEFHNNKVVGLRVTRD